MVDMEVKIRPFGYGQVLEVEMGEGDSIYAEPGAFMACDGEVELESKLRGGFISSILRKIGGKETMFISKITAKEGSTMLLTPPLPSEIAPIRLKGRAFILGDGAYLAHEGEVDVSAEPGFLTSLVAGSGLMFLYAKGKGTLYINGEGGLHRAIVKKGESLLLDNDHFVAVNADANVEKLFIGKGLKSKLFGGEGLVFRIRGPAEVYYRLNSPSNMASKIARKLRL
ncbi:MAG: TIGR00266 family protein [Methanobacteriota archaeon]|nr:MAG: TIGR00266 family protein [Euryarchaeota archaeon]